MKIPAALVQNDEVKNQRGTYCALMSLIGQLSKTTKLQGQVNTQTECLRQHIPRGAKLSKTNAHIPFSVLHLNTGKMVHLTHRLTSSALCVLEQYLQTSIPKAKTLQGDYALTLGQGAFGTVKFGLIQDTSNLIPVAIKRIKDPSAAQKELTALSQATSPFIPKLHGYAEATNAKGQVKHYLVSDFVSGGDGNAMAKKLIEVEPQERAGKVMAIALGYCTAIESLHKQGLYHSDLKLDNFLHGLHEKSYVTDLGLAHKHKALFKGGTSLYQPPETELPTYHAGKHDSFSFGICCLALYFGGAQNIPVPCELKTQNTKGQQKTFMLQSSFGQARQFFGLADTQNVKVRCFEDVVIKLLDQDPSKRLSIKQALKHLGQLQSALEHNEIESESEAEFPTFDEWHQLLKGFI